MNKIELKYLILNFSMGREYLIKSEQFIKVLAERSLPLFVFEFPNSMVEMEKLNYEAQ